MWILTCDEEVHIIHNVCAEQEGAKQRVDRHANWPWPVLGGGLSDACHHISPEQCQPHTRCMQEVVAAGRLPEKQLDEAPQHHGPQRRKQEGAHEPAHHCTCQLLPEHCTSPYAVGALHIISERRARSSSHA